MLLILCLLLQIIAVIFAFAATDDLKRFAEKQWESLSSSDREEFESNNDCCGFETGTEGCGDQIGCYNVIEDKLKEHLLIIGWICIAVFVYQLGLVSFSCFLCKKLPPSKYSRVNE